MSGHRAEGDVVGTSFPLGRRVDVTDFVAGAATPTVHPCVDQLDGLPEPAVTQLEIVVAHFRLAGRGVGIGLECLVFVIPKQAAQDDRLVGEA